MTTPKPVSEVIAGLRNAVTDWDGSQMVDGEPPRDILRCRDLREAADALERIEEEKERATIAGMEEALRNVWQCYTGNHPAYGVGPDWDKALDGCCKLIEADIAKLKARAALR